MNKKNNILKEAIGNVKMVSAGVKNKYGAIDSPKISSEDRVWYPNLHLSSKEAPMLSGCDTGCEITMIVKAKIVSHSLNETQGNKTENFSLEIRKIGVVKTESEDDD